MHDEANGRIPLRGTLIDDENLKASGSATLPSTNPATERAIERFSMRHRRMSTARFGLRGMPPPNGARPHGPRAQILNDYADVRSDHVDEPAVLDADAAFDGLNTSGTSK
jgi:hypothetical protein